MPPIRKILVPTDFSPTAERALEYALRLAPDGAEVVLLHVFAFPFDWYFWDLPGVESLKQGVEEEARSQLQALIADCKTVNVVTTGRFEVKSHVSRTILAVIGEELPDVVVLGTKGWGDERPQMGTVAEQIARYAESPVLIVPESAPGFSESPSVLVPLYASPANAAALQLGETIAETLGGRVDIFHVLPDVQFGSPFLGDEPVEAGDLLEPEQRLKWLRKFADENAESGAVVEVHLGEGDFVEEVVAFAKDEQVDLVVLGRSEAKNRLHKAELVAHNVACPVLVVPAKLPLPNAPASTEGAYSHSMHEVSQ